MSTNEKSDNRPAPQPIPRWLKIAGPVVGLAVVTGLLLMFIGGGKAETEEPEPVRAEPVAEVDQGNLNELEMLLASLEARVASQDEDLRALRSEQRDFREKLDGLESALDHQGPDQAVTDRLEALQGELMDLRAEVESSEALEPIEALRGDLNATQRRVARLEETPETPEPNATLTGIEHWGARHFAILEGASGRERIRVGGRYGQWTLESLDPDAGVAVLRHPRGFMHALAIHDE
ncbi:hypothetical protein [Thioalkalivibrio halophilus]|uniref:Uncharacterized protein n=1 Tax=Thioalkalivibrio halophilus TaxID=252474 RepID=A0A1V2ZY65_9GAMM|nr:hypothetical protein [Thioalkalivibrio halophilus]OOC10064.1 hypothetical protein B1A74_07745 [Thioalkalivibrio halophilus]